MPDKPLQSELDSYLVPVYDSPNVRTSNSGAGINFEQSYINCYPEVYKHLSSYVAPQIAAIKRPGTIANAALSPTIASYQATGLSDRMTCLCNMVVTQDRKSTRLN